ncbi:MAG: hypothetical protein AYK22_08730 [Thermoplasmatales archaeon SG8-52-3]|nr:MAG: hypothetical protein AYK22_08730 [Thermoplasmatales archaeon SG8-52-3]
MGRKIWWSDLFRNIKQTHDDGYIAVGVWNSTSHWLVRLDENGNEIWNTTALPNETHWPRCYIVEQTSDNGFVTAGCHENPSYGVGYNRCIWKVDEDGNTEWLKIYDDPLNGYHMCIQETEDGGYIVSGEEYISANDWDVFLMKTDSLGNVEWQHTYRYGEYGDNAYAVRQTEDGGYILSGRKGITRSYADYLVIKTDSNGNEEWNKTYGGKGWDGSQSNDILFAEDGGYYFQGETASFGAGARDIWLIKTDADGNEEWNKTYGGEEWDMCGGMDFTEGGIIMVGTIDVYVSSPPQQQGIVIKTDLNGNIEWQQTFGYEEIDQLQSVESTNDGGYIVAGNSDATESSGYGMYDAWLIKIEAFENDLPDKPDAPSGKKKIDVGVEYTYSSSATDTNGDILYYTWDWGDNTTSELLGPYNPGDVCEATHNWTEEGNYLIVVKVTDEHSAESEWSDPLEVSTPRNRATYNTLLIRLFQRFPNALPILRQLIEPL